MALILDRARLCEAFGVSDSTVSAWEKKGMPALRKGRGRGMRSLYDYDQVNAWRREHGYGLQGSPQMLAREASPRISDVPQPKPPAKALMVQTSGPLRAPTIDELGRLIGTIFGNSLIPSAAIATHRYKLEPGVALDVYEDLLLIVMYAAAAELKLEDFRVLLAGELGIALDRDQREALLQRIAEVAEQYARDSELDAGDEAEAEPAGVEGASPTA